MFELYIIDSHGKAKDGAGYAPVDKEQIGWYVSRREQRKAENGDYLPSLVFQHIPVPEFFDVIKKVPKGTKGAVPAYGAHENEFLCSMMKLSPKADSCSNRPLLPM